jgi:membrane-associated phospholipid phosphatase
MALFGLSTAQADVVTDWNEATIGAIRSAAWASNPGESTRCLAMVSAAVYEAVNSVTGTHAAYQQSYNVGGPTSAQAAAAQAAHNVLVTLFPDQAASFSTLLNTHLSGVTNADERLNGILLGAQVSGDIMALRSYDGSQVQMNYTPQAGVGHWRPDPLHPNQSAWGADWGKVTTWSGASSSAYRPVAPPSLTSTEYAQSYNQVKSLGALNSTTRTADQTQIGVFWGYDRAALGPPPILYNQIIKTVAELKGNTLEQNARLFALANMAMADASIAAWDAKFEYDLWRPITAIREGALDGNPWTDGDVGWIPLGAPGDPNDPNSDFTPPFPAYLSGHATMGAAAFGMLEAFYGSDNIGQSLQLGSDELPGVLREFTHFSQMTDENAWSRIYLGVHFDFDSLVGNQVGSAIAGSMYGTMLQQVPEPSSVLLISALSIGAIIRRRRR